MPELSIFSKNLEPIAKNRLLELLSSLKIDDPNWIDENLWKKYRDAIPIVPAVTWPKLIDYFQNEKVEILENHCKFKKKLLLPWSRIWITNGLGTLVG
uniref:Uncharacterized protein n=1 Tax=Daphnia magna TaxID=35525 RepID=A0A0P6GAI3_9CRUS